MECDRPALHCILSLAQHMRPLKCVTHCLAHLAPEMCDPLPGPPGPWNALHPNTFLSALAGEVGPEFGPSCVHFVARSMVPGPRFGLVTQMALCNRSQSLIQLSISDTGVCLLVILWCISDTVSGATMYLWAMCVIMHPRPPGRHIGIDG